MHFRYKGRCTGDREILTVSCIVCVTDRSQIFTPSFTFTQQLRGGGVSRNSPWPSCFFASSDSTKPGSAGDRGETREDRGEIVGKEVSERERTNPTFLVEPIRLFSLREKTSGLPLISL